MTGFTFQNYPSSPIKFRLFEVFNISNPIGFYVEKEDFWLKSNMVNFTDTVRKKTPEYILADAETRLMIR
jgi:hypothetical protein